MFITQSTTYLKFPFTHSNRPIPTGRIQYVVCIVQSQGGYGILVAILKNVVDLTHGMSDSKQIDVAVLTVRQCVMVNNPIQ